MWQRSITPTNEFSPLNWTFFVLPGCLSSDSNVFRQTLIPLQFYHSALFLFVTRPLKFASKWWRPSISWDILAYSNCIVRENEFSSWIRVICYPISWWIRCKTRRNFLSTHPLLTLDDISLRRRPRIATRINSWNFSFAGVVFCSLKCDIFVYLLVGKHIEKCGSEN